MKNIIKNFSWWLVLPFFCLMILIGCNTASKLKDKETYKSTSNIKLSGEYKLSDDILKKVEESSKTNFRYVEESSKKQDVIEDETSIIVEDGEITKTDKNGNATTIKGKGISTNNKNKSSVNEEYVKKEINKSEEAYTKKLDSVSKKIDSTYQAKYDSFIKQKDSHLEKKTSRFPIIIPIVLAIATLVYFILKRHKLI